MVRLMSQSKSFDFRIYIIIMMGKGVNKPLGGELDDSVELSLQGSRTLAHLDVLAVFSDW